jgi:hypothetical protein
MLNTTTRAVLLGSAAALSLSVAHAQTGQSVSAQGEACVTLANQMTDDVRIEDDVRTQLEDVIAAGDVTQCELVVRAWEREGTITRESLELVVTEEVTERMIVQQEVEVEADAAVYQPPAEVDVDTGTPEVLWTIPRQTLTVTERAPEITVRQGRPQVSVEVPQPRVRVMIPEPEVIVTWPESTLDVAELQPDIEVRIPEPSVQVTMPDPVVELTIGGADPSGLVQLDDGRFAPAGATADELEPQIRIRQEEARVSRANEAEAPEITFDRGEPVVLFEGGEPDVTVEVVGEPDIQVMQQGATPDDPQDGGQQQ